MQKPLARRVHTPTHLTKAFWEVIVDLRWDFSPVLISLLPEIKSDPGEVGLRMHADLHSEVKHLSLNRFRVTMDTAHATSEVFIQNKIQKKNIY